VRFVPGSLVGDAKDRVVQVSRSLFLWFCFDIVGVGSNELRGPMQSLVDVRGMDAANLRDIINVIAHGHEEVEEELRVTLLHLHLHRAAAFESLAATDDKC